jgi:hypothetical protein
MELFVGMHLVYETNNPNSDENNPCDFIFHIVGATLMCAQNIKILSAAEQSWSGGTMLQPWC